MERVDGSETLLVVEDEEAVRSLVTRALRSHGFQVREADGAEAAMKIIERHGPPDLLVTDVVMPITSGPEFVGRLREAHPELRVLYISGYAQDKLDELLRLSDVPLLEKPFTMDALLAAVRAALS